MCFRPPKQRVCCLAMFRMVQAFLLLSLWQLNTYQKLITQPSCTTGLEAALVSYAVVAFHQCLKERNEFH
jgi:hypothetical protein